jgi:hypothetical protein
VLAGTVTLRSKEDLSGYCKSDPHNFELLRDVDSRRLTFFNLTAAQVAVDQPLV